MLLYTLASYKAEKKVTISLYKWDIKNMKNKIYRKDQGLARVPQDDNTKNHAFIQAINIGRESGTSPRSFEEIISDAKHKTTKI